MGRPPIFGQPMTGAERSRRARQQKKDDGMSKASDNQYVAVPAPGDRAALIAQRKKLANVRNLNDFVEDVFVSLYDADKHPAFVALVTGVQNSDTVEGSTDADDYEAARYIRDYARKEIIPMIPQRNLHTIASALRVVMRRYSMSRMERRLLVHGVSVQLEFGGVAGTLAGLDGTAAPEPDAGGPAE